MTQLNIEPYTVTANPGTRYIAVSNLVTSYIKPTWEQPKPTHCPSCGAPLNHDKDKCEYCGTSWR